MENSVSKYTRFDRHEIYCDDMQSLNMALTWKTSGSVRNKMFGLFDGYLYTDLKDEKYLQENGCSFDTIQKIKVLIMHIERKLNIDKTKVLSEINGDGWGLKVLEETINEVSQ